MVWKNSKTPNPASLLRSTFEHIVLSNGDVVLCQNAYHRFIDWNIAKQQRENDCFPNKAKDTDAQIVSLQG